MRRLFVLLMITMMMTLGLQPVLANDPAPKQTYTEQTNNNHKTPWYKTRTTKITAGGAGAGAVFGALVGGRKGAGLGALTGGAAGYLYERTTRDKNKK